jgi:hypothetical protein
VQFIPVALPAKHLLCPLPLRTKEDDAWLGRPRPVRACVCMDGWGVYTWDEWGCGAGGVGGDFGVWLS